MLRDPVNDLFLSIYHKAIEIEWGFHPQRFVSPQKLVDFSCLLDLTPHRFNMNVSIECGSHDQGGPRRHQRQHSIIIERQPGFLSRKKP
jgi:hypothetical protein